MSKAARLRALLERKETARIVGSRDALTALLVEEAGFDGLWASSFEISASRALPDLGLLTMAELLEASSHVNEATSLPLLADCDTGFGGRINVVRTVQQFEAAGVAGVCFEDKVFPKRNSFLLGGQNLEEAEEFAGRIEAGARARRSSDFTLVARTEALIAGRGLDEALRRAHLYADAGADAILIHSKKRTPVEVLEFLQAWQARTPVVIVPTTYPHWDLADAQAAGVSMVIYANHALRASVSAMRDVLTEIRVRGGTGAIEDRVAPMKELFGLTDVSKWEEWSA
ncbi:isocitrate lyase/phosphoenolpyruvate mutase family protein [Wenjunlia tyrosinilytica]|uniref:Phosphoenolpyruvate phosphomutase n=1 Tax=Wenjunlia tyrosinilytica TaxID=1544741 RepID=A0A918DSW7_9ACTN|nr:isocitrate lyase/phosphoenolpyruvate mutase family protein [Wenjunlia tyrosinilytica]GGO82106.1 phosphoenolpyruvate phosphomutase [Wenjunlia tyrosinilytica]